MAKCKVWKRTDGQVSVTNIDFRLKKDNETEDAFIERVSQKLRLRPFYQGAQEFVMDTTDLPKKDKNRRKWRINPQGKVTVDPSIELPEEARRKKLQAIRVKLKTGQALDEEEANLLLGL